MNIVYVTVKEDTPSYIHRNGSPQQDGLYWNDFCLLNPYVANGRVYISGIDFEDNYSHFFLLKDVATIEEPAYMLNKASALTYCELSNGVRIPSTVTWTQDEIFLINPVISQDGKYIYLTALYDVWQDEFLRCLKIEDVYCVNY